MTLSQVQSGYYEGETLAELEKLILWEMGQVVGTNISYDRFPQWLIRKKLTVRHNNFVFQSQCLRKMALLLAKKDYRQYKLPVNCMENGLISAKYYNDSTSYEELEIVDDEFMNSDEMDGYLVEGSSTPEYVWMGDSYGNIPMINVHPAPDEDGTSYADGDDLGVVIGGDELPEISNNVTGQATGGDGTTLDDTNVDFTTMGLAPGMYVRNVSDASYAYIQTIAATKLTFTAALTGGTADTFSAGDSYNILAGEYGVLTSWENDDQYLFAYEMGVLANITVPSGNIRIEFIPYPMAFLESSSDNQIPEIPKLYHQSLAMGVVADLLRTFNEKTKEFARSSHYEALYQSDVSLAKEAKQARPFRNKPVQIRPRFR